MFEIDRDLTVDVLYPPSGGIKKSFIKGGIIAGDDITSNPGERARYSSTAFNDPDSRRSLGWGKAKVVACAELAKKYFPNATIIANSRSSNNKSFYSDAYVMEQELRRLGVKNQILKEENSLDTFSELIELLRLSGQLGYQNLLIVTTRYQRPRAEAMLYSLQNVDKGEERQKIEQMLDYNQWRFPDRLSDHELFRLSYEYLLTYCPHVFVSFLDVEDILPYRSPLYGSLIRSAQSDPIYQLKLKMDIQAAIQWQAGEYGKR